MRSAARSKTTTRAVKPYSVVKKRLKLWLHRCKRDNPHITKLCILRSPVVPRGNQNA